MRLTTAVSEISMRSTQIEQVSAAARCPERALVDLSFEFSKYSWFFDNSHVLTIYALT